MQKTAWENIDNYEHDVRKSDGKFFSSTTVYAEKMCSVNLLEQQKMSYIIVNP